MFLGIFVGYGEVRAKLAVYSRYKVSSIIRLSGVTNRMVRFYDRRFGECLSFREEVAPVMFEEPSSPQQQSRTQVTRSVGCLELEVAELAIEPVEVEEATRWSMKSHWTKALRCKVSNRWRVG